MLLPVAMRFSISATAIFGFIEEREQIEPVESKEVLREVALRYERMYDLNARRIRRLAACFQLAIVCLLAETGLWISVVVEGVP
jgi:hypothetical protein